MSGRITFTIVKPEAVAAKYTGSILKMVSDNGFHIAALKMILMSRTQAEAFYSVHRERAFYNDLVSFMISGPVIVAILEKDNAVADYRTLIGSTDPAKAADGTIRKFYARSVQENAVHGSDSDENAILECAFFFSGIERFYK